MAANEYDVIIVGGGISGLTAAYTVKKKIPDARVIVLEGKDRVGGRTVTLPLVGAKGTDRWDLGGQWVGSCQRHVMQLINELGLETYPQYTTGHKLQQLEGLKVTSYSSDIPSLSVLSLIDLYWHLSKIERYERQIDILDPCSHPKAEEWDAMTIAAYMDKTMYTQGAREAVNSACRVVFGCETNQISLLFYLVYLRMANGLDKIIEAKENTAQEAKIKGGAQQISLSLVKNLGNETIRLGDPASSIQQSDDGVRVVTANGWLGKAPYAIIATPPAAMDHIKFEPQLSSARRDLIKRMPMGSITKIILTFQTAFWRDEGLSGEVVSGGVETTLLVECPQGPVTLCYDAGSDKSSPALVAFIGGDISVAYADMTSRTRQERVLEHLSMFFGPQVRKFLDYVEKDWDLEPFSWGGPVSYLGPGSMHLFASTIRRPEGRLHFAGTETAIEWSGYMSGAIQAGEATALSVLQRFKPSCLSESEREIIAPYAALGGDGDASLARMQQFQKKQGKISTVGYAGRLVGVALAVGLVATIVHWKCQK